MLLPVAIAEGLLVFARELRVVFDRVALVTFAQDTLEESNADSLLEVARPELVVSRGDIRPVSAASSIGSEVVIGQSLLGVSSAV